MTEKWIDNKTLEELAFLLYGVVDAFLRKGTYKLE